MSTKIRFSDVNQTEFPLFDSSGSSFEGEEFYNGYNRRVCTFILNPNEVSLDELNNICSNESNLETITVVVENGGDNTLTSIKEGFILKIQVGVISTLIQNETLSQPAVYEDRLIVKLGKLTYSENLLRQLAKKLED